MVVPFFSKRAERLRRSEIHELLKLTIQTDTISFAGDLPASAIFPYDAILAASICAINERANKTLQHCPAEGGSYLKEQLIQVMNRNYEVTHSEDTLFVSFRSKALTFW